MSLAGRRAALLVTAAAGCYAPAPAPGVPCSPALACPTGQSCDLTNPAGPTCVTAPSSQSGDPAEATDVADGGLFTFDARGARDDVAAPCADGGGPEVYFRISLPAPEVVYLDAIGSSGGAAIAIHAGACTELGEVQGCAARTCGDEAQGAFRLPAGDHCIVVDHTGAPSGPGQLRVVRGRRDGEPLPDRSGTVTGDTCRDDNSNDAGCGCEPAEDHHYFFTLCPGAASVSLQTCNGASWDTVLQLRDGADAGLACNDDRCSNTQSSITRDVTGPGLFWAIVDGCDECGTYTMQYSY